ncbi:MAG TPA: hypothetical protein DHV84_06170 [Desulfotomaculum sp.]|nr:hypothetical protein [Desulfotomaculum sp.]
MSEKKPQDNIKEMEKCGVYIYGIIKEPHPKSFDFLGIEDCPVHTVNYLEMAAVVSKIREVEVYPTRKNLLAHTKVQDILLGNYTLLPMVFGVIAQSEVKQAGSLLHAGQAGSLLHIKKLLENNYLGLEQELKRLSEKIEVELKVFWNKDALNQELANSYKYTKIVNQIKETSASLKKQNLLAEAGELVEKVALKWQKKIDQEVYHSLKSLAVEACLNKLSGITNILNASFLVEKTKENEFRAQVYQYDALYEDKVNFKYIAPLPPYNFVRLKLKEGK